MFRALFRKKNNRLLFTTPSHSQKFCIVSKFRHFYKYDISETDTHNPEIVLEEAQKKASKVYGTKQTLFLTNGSTSGIITGVLACVKNNDKVLIWNNAHKCHKNAVELAGGEPIFYQIPMNNDWGIPQKVTVDILKPHFQKEKIKAVIITSPSYYGIVSEIKEIKEFCHNNGAYLIVDEAHGALYPFSDRLPESAVKYADIIVQSLHKTAGGLNPTALIHSNLDFDIKPYFDKINTTSPSYPMLASIEANIKFLNSKKGQRCIDNLIDNINILKSKCTHLRFGGDDPTKILIKHPSLSGYELSETLYNKFNIEDEITNEKSTMLLCGIGTTSKKLKKLGIVLSKFR